MCRVKFQFRVKFVFLKMSLRVFKQLPLSLQFYKSEKIDFIKGFPVSSDELDTCDISNAWHFCSLPPVRRPCKLCPEPPWVFVKTFFSLSLENMHAYSCVLFMLMFSKGLFPRGCKALASKLLGNIERVPRIWISLALPAVSLHCGFIFLTCGPAASQLPSSFLEDPLGLHQLITFIFKVKSFSPPCGFMH